MNVCEELDALLKECGLTVKFGLRAQGHIPTVEQMLAEGKSWDEIGAAIGWHGPTVKRFYERDQLRVRERHGEKTSEQDGVLDLKPCRRKVICEH